MNVLWQGRYISKGPVVTTHKKDMALTQENTQIIRSTVPVLVAHGNAITTAFYSTLLHDVPELSNVFNLTNQTNNQQPKALAYELHATAANIDNVEELIPFGEK